MRTPALVAAVTLTALLGAGTAAAAWEIPGPGVSTGRAGTLTAPGNVAAAAPACSGTTGTVRFTWTAPAGAVSYQHELATNAAFTQGFQTATTTNTTATASSPNATLPRTLYFRTRAVAGAWVSPNSAVVSAVVGPCLL